MNLIFLSWLWFISQAISSVAQPPIHDLFEAKKMPSHDLQQNLLSEDMGKEIPLEGKKPKYKLRTVKDLPLTFTKSIPSTLSNESNKVERIPDNPLGPELPGSIQAPVISRFLYDFKSNPGEYDQMVNEMFPRRKNFDDAINFAVKIGVLCHQLAEKITKDARDLPRGYISNRDNRHIAQRMLNTGSFYLARSNLILRLLKQGKRDKNIKSLTLAHRILGSTSLNLTGDLRRAYMKLVRHLTDARRAYLLIRLTEFSDAASFPKDLPASWKNANHFTCMFSFQILFAIEPFVDYDLLDNQYQNYMNLLDSFKEEVSLKEINPNASDKIFMRYITTTLESKLSAALKKPVYQPLSIINEETPEVPSKDDVDPQKASKAKRRKRLNRKKKAYKSLPSRMVPIQKSPDRQQGEQASIVNIDKPVDDAVSSDLSHSEDDELSRSIRIESDEASRNASLISVSGPSSLTGNANALPAEWLVNSCPLPLGKAVGKEPEGSSSSSSSNTYWFGNQNLLSERSISTGSVSFSYVKYDGPFPESHPSNTDGDELRFTQEFLIEEHKDSAETPPNGIVPNEQKGSRETLLNVIIANDFLSSPAGNIESSCEDAYTSCLRNFKVINQPPVDSAKYRWIEFLANVAAEWIYEKYDDRFVINTYLRAKTNFWQKSSLDEIRNDLLDSRLKIFNVRVVQDIFALIDYLPSACLSSSSFSAVKTQSNRDDIELDRPAISFISSFVESVIDNSRKHDRHAVNSDDAVDIINRQRTPLSMGKYRAVILEATENQFPVEVLDAILLFWLHLEESKYQMDDFPIKEPGDDYSVGEAIEDAPCKVQIVTVPAVMSSNGKDEEEMGQQPQSPNAIADLTDSIPFDILANSIPIEDSIPPIDLSSPSLLKVDAIEAEANASKRNVILEGNRKGERTRSADDNGSLKGDNKEIKKRSISIGPLPRPVPSALGLKQAPIEKFEEHAGFEMKMELEKEPSSIPFYPINLPKTPDNLKNAVGLPSTIEAIDIKPAFAYEEQILMSRLAYFALKRIAGEKECNLAVMESACIASTLEEANEKIMASDCLPKKVANDIFAIMEFLQSLGNNPVALPAAPNDQADQEDFDLDSLALFIMEGFVKVVIDKIGAVDEGAMQWKDVACKIPLKFLFFPMKRYRKAIQEVTSNKFPTAALDLIMRFFLDVHNLAAPHRAALDALVESCRPAQTGLLRIRIKKTSTSLTDSLMSSGSPLIESLEQPSPAVLDDVEEQDSLGVLYPFEDELFEAEKEKQLPLSEALQLVEEEEKDSIGALYQTKDDLFETEKKPKSPKEMSVVALPDEAKAPIQLDEPIEKSDLQGSVVERRRKFVEAIRRSGGKVERSRSVDNVHLLRKGAPEGKMKYIDEEEPIEMPLPASPSPGIQFESRPVVPAVSSAHSEAIAYPSPIQIGLPESSGLKIGEKDDPISLQIIKEKEPPSSSEPVSDEDEKGIFVDDEISAEEKHSTRVHETASASGSEPSLPAADHANKVFDRSPSSIERRRQFVESLHRPGQSKIQRRRSAHDVLGKDRKSMKGHRRVKTISPLPSSGNPPGSVLAPSNSRPGPESAAAPPSPVPSALQSFKVDEVDDSLEALFPFDDELYQVVREEHQPSSKSTLPASSLVDDEEKDSLEALFPFDDDLFEVKKEKPKQSDAAPPSDVKSSISDDRIRRLVESLRKPGDVSKLERGRTLDDLFKPFNGGKESRRRVKSMGPLLHPAPSRRSVEEDEIIVGHVEKPAVPVESPSAETFVEPQELVEDEEVIAGHSEVEEPAGPSDSPSDETIEEPHEQAYPKIDMRLFVDVETISRIRLSDSNELTLDALRTMPSDGFRKADPSLLANLRAPRDAVELNGVREYFASDAGQTIIKSVGLDQRKESISACEGLGSLFEVLPEEAIRAIRPDCLMLVEPVFFQKLDSHQTAAFSPQSVASMMADQVREMDPKAFAGLKKGQLEAVSRAVATLPEELLSVSGCAGITAAQLGMLQSSDGLSLKCLQCIPVPELAALPADVFRKLIPKAYFTSLTSSAFQSGKTQNLFFAKASVGQLLAIPGTFKDPLDNPYVGLDMDWNVLLAGPKKTLLKGLGLQSFRSLSKQMLQRMPGGIFQHLSHSLKTHLEKEEFALIPVDSLRAKDLVELAFRNSKLIKDFTADHIRLLLDDASALRKMPALFFRKLSADAWKMVVEDAKAVPLKALSLEKGSHLEDLAWLGDANGVVLTERHWHNIAPSACAHVKYEHVQAGSKATAAFWQGIPPACLVALDFLDELRRPEALLIPETTLNSLPKDLRQTILRKRVPRKKLAGTVVPGEESDTLLVDASTLTAEIIGAMKTEELAGITAELFAELPLETLSSLKPAVAKALPKNVLRCCGPAQIGALSPEFIAALSAAQVRAIRSKACAGLSAFQAAAIPLAWLAKSQFHHLDPSVFAQMTSDMLSMIPDAIWRSVISKEQVRFIPPAVLAAFSRFNQLGSNFDPLSKHHPCLGVDAEHQQVMSGQTIKAFRHQCQALFDSQALDDQLQRKETL